MATDSGRKIETTVCGNRRKMLIPGDLSDTDDGNVDGLVYGRFRVENYCLIYYTINQIYTTSAGSPLIPKHLPEG